jgi:hypothetical protein
MCTHFIFRKKEIEYCCYYNHPHKDDDEDDSDSDDEDDVDRV